VDARIAYDVVATHGFRKGVVEVVDALFVIPVGEPFFDDLAVFNWEVTRDEAQRCVWGNDWPHVTERVPRYDPALPVWFNTTIEDYLIRHLILVENPKMLYGFA
jgi:hypothetical protein